MFVALKASSLPWSIMFVALVSMFALKVMGNTNVNEINMAHTCISAGSMVAGGLARLVIGKAAPKFAEGSTGTVIASGLLAGEGFLGVCIAMYQAIQILMAA